MRIILVTVIAVCLVNSALAEEHGIDQAADIILFADHSAGAVRLTLSDNSATPFDHSFVRFILLPDGAENPSIPVSMQKTLPGLDLTLLPPMVARGLTIHPLVVAPSANKSAAAAPRSIEFDVRYDGGEAGKTQSASLAHSRGFFDSFLSLFPDGEMDKYTSDSEGGYLIVTDPSFVTTLEPLVDWKRQVGFEVTVVTTDVTGTTNNDIRAYIQSLYTISSLPPQYLLLVGDVEQVPGFDFQQSVSDLPYSLLDGDDFLPDLEVGRLSAQTTEDLNTMIAKILRYESDPYTDNEAWYSRALLVAGDYSSSTPVPVSRWCREQLYNIGYTEVDSVFYPPHWSTGPPLITMSIDQGVSLVSYRGWAYGWQGWEPPKFTVDHIPGLSNGWMLPAVFSFVCLNNDFAEPECFGEAWLRAGTATEPKGAVAFLGNSEHWSHTRFNDAAAIGAFKAMNDSGVRRFGQILNASRSEIMLEFPDQMYYVDHEDASVEFYYYIYSLLGDPSMELWTAAPTPIAVSHPDTIALGSSFFFVVVEMPGTSVGLSGLRVGFSRGDELLGCEYTDSNGQVELLTTFDSGDPVVITVTGGGVAPYRGTVEVVDNHTHLGLESVTVRDDGTGRSLGNGNGILNPGETVEIRTTLSNDTDGDATSVRGFLTQTGFGYTVQTEQIDFPDIPAGGSAASDTTWVVTIDNDVADGLVARFLLQAFTGGIETQSGFDLVIAAPDLRYSAHLLDGDGILDPGESVWMSVTIINDGSADAPSVNAVLRSETPHLAFANAESLAVYNPILSGASDTATSRFRIVASDSAAIGQAAVFTLMLSTVEGYEMTTGFSVGSGTVDHGAPLGPDNYGYYAYDNSDTDYPETAPLYDWVTCSSVYGGSGTKLDLDDNEMMTVTLPFGFQYYGTHYNSLTICDNGWASFESASYFDFYNWVMPNTYGNGAMLAPFWDNLNPEKEYDGTPVGDGIYIHDDTANHRFVVEWSRLGNERSQNDAHEEYDDLQTFQLILLDPDHYTTPTGDGIVRFQYKRIVNNDTDRMYATVGIENAEEDDGILYTYVNEYPAAAAPLSAGLAIDFTTVAPRYVPFSLAMFAAKECDSGVQIRWEPTDERPRSGYRVYREATDGTMVPVPGGVLGPNVREFTDLSAAGEEEQVYWIGSTDLFGKETLLGPFPYKQTETPSIRFALANQGPNPSHGTTVLRYSLPAKSDANLGIYSVSGRHVRTLVNRSVSPGVWTAEWDGRDESGREMPSGVYFGRLRAEAGERRVKFILLR